MFQKALVLSARAPEARKRRPVPSGRRLSRLESTAGYPGVMNDRHRPRVGGGTFKCSRERFERGAAVSTATECSGLASAIKRQLEPFFCEKVLRKEAFCETLYVLGVSVSGDATGNVK